MIKYDRNKLVFMDTETTGLYPWMGHEVWEIAYIRWNSRTQGWMEDVIHIKPSDLSKADPMALTISRFYDRTRKADGFSWNDPYNAVQVLARAIDGKHVVGAIPWFDIEMLRNFFMKYDHAPPTCHYHLIDVEALALGAIAGRNPLTTEGDLDISLPWKSEWMFELLGLEPMDKSKAHTALYDAQRVRDVWLRVMGDGRGDGS